MPLPIKQYKHMFKDVKFLATTAQPSHKEVSHWIDLLEDPTGGTIKVWNGTGWKKISGEGDGDTGLVIGDTTGTAYDGGKGKELETEVDTIKKNTNNAALFRFDTLYLKNKPQSFLQKFLLYLSDSNYSSDIPVIFQYTHNYDLSNDTVISNPISSVVTVAQTNIDASQYTAEYALYSNIYHSESNNRDQFIKITASFDFSDESNAQAEFQVEEIPVDLNGASGNNLFYVFPEDKLVDGAVLTEEEYNDLQKAIYKHKIALFGNNIMQIGTQLDSSRIYFYINTNYIDREYIAPDDYYSHVFLYLIGSIDTQRTVHISDEYNRKGSLCYVYGQDHDIMFVPVKTIVQDSTKFIEAMKMANMTMFVDFFEEESVGIMQISKIGAIGASPAFSIDNIYTSEQAINLKVQSRYLTEADDGGLSISKTVNKTIELKLSGDGTKFLSDNGRYKEIDLSSKQDALVSGINIKTVNGNSLLGEGNIEIQGGGNGIADAPSDGKKYIRQNANWVEETTVDTSTKYVNMTVESNVDILDEVTIDGKVYDFINDGIYDTDLLNYLKDIYNADKSLMIEYTEHANDGSIFSTKYNTYVSYRNDGESHEMYAIDLKPISNVIISVADPSNKPQPS